MKRFSPSAHVIFARALLGLSLACALPLAHAGILEDDEARKAILDLRNKSDAQQRQLSEILQRLDKLEAVTKGQLLLAHDQESLKRELAKLRGELEVAVNDIAQSQRKSRDLYTDVDSRLKKLEPKAVTIDGKSTAVGQDQISAYENALASFKAGEFQTAESALESFVKRYPNSPYAAAALYFQGSAQYALKDYKGALRTQNDLVRQYPDSARAADAMLNISVNQLELKDKKGARKTLEQLVERYPDTPAAATAKERLKGSK
ncbi:MAG: tol-pal system protein YbgF [Burkholderiaceae bacterium]